MKTPYILSLLTLTLLSGEVLSQTNNEQSQPELLAFHFLKTADKTVTKKDNPQRSGYDIVVAKPLASGNTATTNKQDTTKIDKPKQKPAN
ncbi:MAG: hypothetical protein OEZ58_09335 [Gammaproteobacteria bacterium]|nr:hypothetical protein [Gammaproteobacteria bacterium]